MALQSLRDTDRSSPPQSTSAAAIPSECRASSSNDSPKAIATDIIETEGAALLAALWPTHGLHHQLAVMDQRRQFCGIHVSTIEQAVRTAARECKRGHEVYFACAEYRTSIDRTATNAACASAFWLDLDCGANKAETGAGYATPLQAQAALNSFCAALDLPQPTHVVGSGNGLHVYWVLDTPLQADQWIQHARDLKALAAAHGLRADPTRTADIASILRVPGTLNHKSTPPKQVQLLYAEAQRIGSQLFVGRLSSARLALALTATAVQPTPVLARDGRYAFDAEHLTPSLDGLAAALRLLDPDCDEATWKLRRIAPMARAARQHPQVAAGLKGLAKSWSSGDLRGVPSKAWVTPGQSNGRMGAAIFESVWHRFMRADYRGTPTTLGTIYHDAALAEWRANAGSRR